MTRAKLYCSSGVGAVPCHPGEYLRDELTALQMTQTALAKAMGRPLPAINEIVQGKKRITADTALDLERVLNVSAGTWLALQAGWDLTVARAKRATS